MRQTFLVLTLLLSTMAIAVATDLAYIDLGAHGSACCLVPDGIGNVYVVGSASSESGTNISVTKVDASNHVVATFRFGGTSDLPFAAALDSLGNLVIVGQTRSSDFPLVHPLIAQTEPGAPAGFIAKVNPSNGQILFSTRFGGAAVERFAVGTTVNAVAVDSAGNIYAAGMTNAKDLPVSANAFQKTGAGGDLFGPQPYGFVVKLSRDGDRFLYSTLLGGSTANCSGGSHCIGKNAYTAVNAIGVDRNGTVTVGGATNALDFPATTGAVQTVCLCQEYANNAFVTRLTPDGSGLIWSTFLGSSHGLPQMPAGINSVSALLLDSGGNVTIVGKTDSFGFPTTSGALQPHFAGPDWVGQRPTDGFLSRLNATGTALVFSTFLGGAEDDQINDLQVDAIGNIWLTGTIVSNSFLGSPAPFTGSFFAEISPDGARLLVSQRTPAGSAGQAIRTGADIRVLGATGSLIQFPVGQVRGAGVFGVASSASGPVKAYVAPGEFISLYGNLLGPEPGVSATLDNQGRVAAQLAGVRVLFNGIPAPLLYADLGQINALVPYGIKGGTVSIQVMTATGDSSSVSLYVRPAQPEVFSVGGIALALNQDNSVNSQQNPAIRGSIVTIFASGAGLFYDQPPDGSIFREPTSQPILPVAVLANNRSVEVLYAGNAPGLVFNTLQVNLRLPQQISTTLFQMIIGEFFSSPFLLFIQ